MNTDTKLGAVVGAVAITAVVAALVVNNNVIEQQKQNLFVKPATKMLIQDSGDYAKWLKSRDTNKIYPRLVRPVSMTEQEMIARAEARAKDRQ